jgi:hypothetical protein
VSIIAGAMPFQKGPVYVTGGHAVPEALKMMLTIQPPQPLYYQGHMYYPIGARMDFASKDGEFGFVKDKAQGMWHKVRLSTGEVVGSLKVSEVRAQKHHHDHHIKKVVSPLATPPAIVRDDYGLNACGHDGTTVVWEYEGKQLFAAGWGGIHPTKYGIVLDLADQSHSPLLSSYNHDQLILPGSPDNYLALNKHLVDEKGRRIPYTPHQQEANVVAFKWRDGRAPNVGADFWEELWEMLPAKTLVCCLGGHGRTGTAIAALMMAADEAIWSPLVAILTVRSKHCPHAVESTKQFKYLNCLAEEWGMPENAFEADKVKFGHEPAALAALVQAKPGRRAAAKRS